MQPRPAHPRGVSAGPRTGPGGFPGGRQEAGRGAGKDGGVSSVEGPYLGTLGLGRVTPRAGEEFPELPGLGGPGNAASSLLSVIPCPCPRWENKDIYAAAIRSLRLRELQNVLTTLSPLEMELRTCGLPYINLEFLKVGGRARLVGACGLSSVQYCVSWCSVPLM